MQTRASAWPLDVSGQTLPVVLVRVHGESRTSTRMQRKQSSRGSCVDGGSELGHGSQLLSQSIGWLMDACLCPCRRHSQWLSLLPLFASPYIQGNLSDNVNVAAETRFAPAHPDLRRALQRRAFGRGCIRISTSYRVNFKISRQTQGNSTIVKLDSAADRRHVVFNVANDAVPGEGKCCQGRRQVWNLQGQEP